MNRKRVLVFAMYFTGSDQPTVEAQNYDQYLALSEKVNLIILAKNITNKSHQNIRIVRVPRSYKPLWALKNIFEFSKAMFKVRNEFDIVFTLMIGPHLLIPAILAKIILNKKFVMNISGPQHAKKIKQNRFNRLIIKLSINLADRISAFSYAKLNIFEYHLGKKIDKRKFFLLPLYLDINKFTPTKFEEKENSIVSIARIFPTKRFENLIEAVPYIVKKIPDVKIKIIGPIKDHEYYNKLKNLATRTGYEKHIEFVGPIPRENIAHWINSAKIFVSTDSSEGYSTSIVEAMSCGMPVIATAKGSIPPSPDGTINGYIIDIKPVILAEKIIMLLQNNALREKIGNSARKTAEKEFSKKGFIEKLSEVFDEVMK